jgi:hypothetical protein
MGKVSLGAFKVVVDAGSYRRLLENGEDTCGRVWERGYRWRTGRVRILARRALDPEKSAKPQQQWFAEELGRELQVEVQKLKKKQAIN